MENRTVGASSAPQGVGHRPKTEEASWTPQGWKEARRAEKEPRRGDLSPEGAGAAAERLVMNKIFRFYTKEIINLHQ